ncbi:MAG: GumC family protein [Fimbriimonadaceae bacterium]
MLLLHLKRVLFFGLLGLIGATAWIFLSPKIYEARLAMQVGDSSPQQADPLMPPEVSKIVNKAEGQLAATEVDFLRQESLFQEAVQKVSAAKGDPKLLDDYKTYYKMYSVTGGPTQADQNPMTISSLAVISARAFDPQTAIDLATEVSTVYTDARQSAVKNANNLAEGELKNQIAFYGHAVDVLDKELENTKTKTGLSDVNLMTKEIEDYVATLQNKKDSLESDLHGSELEVDRLRSELKTMKPTQAGPSTVLRNPDIQAIDDKLSLAKADLAAKSATFLPNAPEVKVVSDQVAELEAQRANVMKQANVDEQKSVQPNNLYETLDGQIVSNAAKVDSLRAQLADVDQQLSTQKTREASLPAAERELNAIMRRRDLTEKQYQAVRASFDSIENRITAAALPAIVLSYPSMEFVKDPVEPNVPRTIIIGLLAGLAIGAIFTASREAVKPVVFSATQLEQATGLPVVATMPKLPGGEVQRVISLVNSGRFPRKNFHDLASVALAERESLPKTVIVCGVDGESSSSMAAVSYAAALARAGLRVTLVDANPGRVITRAFDMEGDNGIVDYLTQAALISQKALAQFSMLTKQNDQLGCKICAYGVADVATLTDFSDDRVAGIIEALKPDSDVLVIETAPSGRQPDAVRMARHAEEVLATFESGTSSDRSVETLRDLFADAGVKKMSMILTSTLERVA